MWVCVCVTSGVVIRNTVLLLQHSEDISEKVLLPEAHQSYLFFCSPALLFLQITQTEYLPRPKVCSIHSTLHYFSFQAETPFSQPFGLTVENTDTHTQTKKSSKQKHISINMSNPQLLNGFQIYILKNPNLCFEKLGSPRKAGCCVTPPILRQNGRWEQW